MNEQYLRALAELMELSDRKNRLSEMIEKGIEINE